MAEKTYQCYSNYGKERYYDRHGDIHDTQDCKTCDIRKICAEARDPGFSKVSFSDAIESIPDASQEEKTEGSGVLGEFIIRMAHASNRNIVRMAVIMARLCGISYQQIGGDLGMSRQAVHKHIKAVAAKNATLGKLLKEKPVINRDIRSEMKNSAIVMQNNKLIREREKRWEKLMTDLTSLNTGR